MHIVSSRIFKIINKPDGRRKVMEQHTDTNGKIWEYRYSTPAETDIDAQLLINAAHQEPLWTEAEDES